MPYWKLSDNNLLITGKEGVFEIKDILELILEVIQETKHGNKHT